MLTNHHIVLDGWSMPILLREIFASYFGQRLPAAASYRTFITWLADRDLDAGAGGMVSEVLAGFDTPTLVGPGIGYRIDWGWDSAVLRRSGYRADHGSSGRAGPLMLHPTVSTVLQGAWAVLLSSLTGTPRCRFRQRRGPG